MYTIEYYAIVKNSEVYFYKLTQDNVLDILSKKRKFQKNITG